MNVAELHSKYIRETKKHPINENSKEGSYSDEYVNWLQNIVVNNNDLHLVMWRCTKDLFMDTGEKVFTKGEFYKQIEFNCDSAIDDTGEEHSFGEWSEFFIAT